MSGIAETILHERDTRDRLFGRLPEPAWLMLLDLSVAEARRRMVSVSSLCIASRSPMTTALRHVELLEHRRLATRLADESDGRRFIMILTDNARSLLADFERQAQIKREPPERIAA